MKDKKGITLIALIITIIVMLILVAITINVALNGGIFNKAKEATEKTQMEADKESLLMAAMTCIGKDGTVDYTELTKEAKKLGFSGSNGVYSKGRYTYTVDKNTGKIIEGGTATSEDEKEQEYQYYTISFKDLSNINFNDYFTQTNEELSIAAMPMAILTNEEMDPGYTIGVYWSTDKNTPLILFTSEATNEEYCWTYLSSESPTWYPVNSTTPAGINTPIFSGNLRILSSSEAEELLGEYAPSLYLTQTQIEALLNLTPVQ